VKIPVTNPRREFCGALIRRLAEAGVQLNITRGWPMNRCEVLAAFRRSPQLRFHFCGRIATPAATPVRLMAEAFRLLQATQAEN